MDAAEGVGGKEDQGVSFFAFVVAVGGRGSRPGVFGREVRIRIYGQRLHASRVRFQCVQFRAGLDVPDNDGCVRAAGDEDVLAVGETDGEDAFDKVRVSSEADSRSAGASGPGPDGFIPAAGVESLFRRRGEGEGC